MIKPNIAKFIKDAKLMISRHSPEILTGVGIAGMITTTVLAVRATPKALALLETERQERIEMAETLNVYTDEGEDKYEPTRITPLDMVKICWKCYIPAAALGLASTVCIVGASSISARRNAALATAYKLSETALTEYQEKVVETIGEKKEQAVRDKVAEEKVKKNPVIEEKVFLTGKGNTYCLEPLSSRYFKSDIEAIRRAVNNLNESMINSICGYVTLNEFYDELGLQHTDLGEIVGWNTSHLIKLDISYTGDEDGNPCAVIGHYNAPKYEYY